MWMQPRSSGSSWALASCRHAHLWDQHCGLAQAGTRTARELLAASGRASRMGSHLGFSGRGAGHALHLSAYRGAQLRQCLLPAAVVQATAEKLQHTVQLPFQVLGADGVPGCKGLAHNGKGLHCALQAGKSLMRQRAETERRLAARRQKLCTPDQMTAPQPKAGGHVANRDSAMCKGRRNLPCRQVYISCSDRWLQLCAIEVTPEVAELHVVHGSTACPAATLKWLTWFSRLPDASTPTKVVTP